MKNRIVIVLMVLLMAPTISLSAETDQHPATQARNTSVQPALIDEGYKNAHPPHYPALARRGGQQGSVVILVTVDAHGEVSNTTVYASSGYRLLDKAAKDATNEWKYHAMTQDGVPLSGGLILVPVTFALATP
jgi:periplasmic protein TonB